MGLIYFFGFGDAALDVLRVINNVVKRNGNRRRRKNRDRSMILRVTDEEHEKITRVADALGYTYTDTFLMGIDELEKKLKGDS